MKCDQCVEDDKVKIKKKKSFQFNPVKTKEKKKNHLHYETFHRLNFLLQRLYDYMSVNVNLKFVKVGWGVSFFLFILLLLLKQLFRIAF